MWTFAHVWFLSRYIFIDNLYLAIVFFDNLILMISWKEISLVVLSVIFLPVVWMVLTTVCSPPFSESKQNFQNFKLLAVLLYQGSGIKERIFFKYFVDLMSNFALISNESHNFKKSFPSKMSNLTFSPVERKTILLRENFNLNLPPRFHKNYKKTWR